MSKAAQPNIVLIITHDTGRHLGCYERPVSTPNLNRLAEQGVLFRQAYCTAPQCSPSRASLITGRVPHRHGLVGLVNRGFQLAPDVPRLPALLAEAGYATHLFGLQHEARDARESGYQFVHEAATRSCHDVTPLVVDFFDHAPPRPFFAMVGFFETHRRFPDSAGPWDDVKVPPYLPNEPEVRQDIADLNQSVRDVDEAVGASVAAVDRAGLADDTVIIYTTDHGIAFPGAKATTFDPGIEISLLARGPGVFSGGRTIDQMVLNADLFPTLLELAGATPPESDGRSLLPLLRGDTDSHREFVVAEVNYHAAYDPVRAIRTTRYKYIRTFEPRSWWIGPNVDGGERMRGYTKDWYAHHEPELFSKPRPSELLFDLQADPLERNNLATAPEAQPIVAQMRERLQTWMQETFDPLLTGPVPRQPDTVVTPWDQWDP